MTWHYHQGATADYYTSQLVPSERMSVDRIRKFAESNIIQANDSISK